ncbi:phage shock protein B [Acetobacteraceae bacterium KSS8]|uniref:Phage shock protein B n=1 Tax=Endosaccharibacter trunci TaxID=2812733 RepID=A0ABT1W3E7_9PROT|nr:phage shock protein B [Acetobacteraceae bacterium KSS8]
MDPATLAVLGGNHFVGDITSLVSVIGGLLFLAWMVKLRHERRMREGQAATLGVEERRALDEMSALAQRMEQRVENLERILDNELSGWRSRMPR